MISDLFFIKKYDIIFIENKKRNEEKNMAFTENGLKAIKAIITNQTPNTAFTAKDISVTPQILVALAKDGYLIRLNTKPASYIYDENCLSKISQDMPKEFSPYSEKELELQAKMSYQELIEYCNNKYGKVSGTYFCNESMKSPNPKIKRGDEGLCIHHVKEDRALRLSNPAFAKMSPWEYQLPENLVYCNCIEHLLLHIKIVEEVDIKTVQTLGTLPGWNGIYIFMLPEIEELYSKDFSVENIHKLTFDKIITPLLENIDERASAIVGINELINICALEITEEQNEI